MYIKQQFTSIIYLLLLTVFISCKNDTKVKQTDKDTKSIEVEPSRNKKDSSNTVAIAIEKEIHKNNKQVVIAKEKKLTLREQLGLPPQHLTAEEIEEIKNKVVPIKFETVEEAKKYLDELDTIIDAINRETDSLKKVYDLGEEIGLRIDSDSGTDKKLHYNSLTKEQVEYLIHMKSFKTAKEAIKFSDSINKIAMNQVITQEEYQEILKIIKESNLKQKNE